MAKTLKLLFIYSSTLFLFIGCQSSVTKEDEKLSKQTEQVLEKKNEKPKEKSKEISLKLPHTMEEFEKFPVGAYGKLSEEERNKSENIEKVVNEIEKGHKKLDTSSMSDKELKNFYMMELFKLTKREFPAYKLDYNPDVKSTPADENEKGANQTLKENLNVEIIIDSSGSMAGKVDGKTKMEVAKEAVRNFAKSLPKEANVSLVAYGHKGSNKEEDKGASCGAIDTVYSRQSYQEQTFQKALDQFQSTGWTPLAGALQKSMDNFASAPGEKNTNIIYVVSDGIETCGGDPVAVAKQLGDSNIQPIVNVIGFDVDNESQQQLKQVAEATKGKYVSAKNTKELENEFKKGKDLSLKWSKWRTKSSLEVSGKATTASLDIYSLEHEWFDALIEQKYFINDVAKQLEKRNPKEEKVIKDAKQELEKYLIDFRDNVMEPYAKDMRAQVDKMKAEKEAEINETYKKNEK